jgi:hypothetical protein
LSDPESPVYDKKAGKLNKYITNPNDPSAPHGKYVQATVEDDEGIIGVGTTEDGLCRLDPKKKTFAHYRADAADPCRIANSFIYRLAHFDSAPDLIWIATVLRISSPAKRFRERCRLWMGTRLRLRRHPFFDVGF